MSRVLSAPSSCLFARLMACCGSVGGGGTSWLPARDGVRGESAAAVAVAAAVAALLLLLLLLLLCSGSGSGSGSGSTCCAGCCPFFWLRQSHMLTWTKCPLCQHVRGQIVHAFELPVRRAAFQPGCPRLERHTSRGTPREALVFSERAERLASSRSHAPGTGRRGP